MKIHLGNNKEVLKNFESNSIDSIVTDPPYELGFMGKSWDSSGIAYDVELWSELLRVLKPGGHLLAFSGTRTYHRMAVAIEDAGFEIRDMIEWVYGSGFPKSLNISKSMEGILGSQGKGFKSAGDDGRKAEFKQDLSKRSDYGYVWEPTDENAKKWNGWGTALKPAHEPICMARKPLEQKTVAENCLKWGTGGINIDESRVGLNGEKTPKGSGNADKSGTEQEWGFVGNGGNETNPKGRFPANIITDGSEEVMACFPETKSGGGDRRSKNSSSVFNPNENRLEPAIFEANEGNASRFFKSIIYTSKPSKAERNLGCEPVFNLFEQSEGLEEKQTKGGGGMNNTEDDVCGKFGSIKAPAKNFHPTVKPIELMEYLIKMVTPKGGIVLDPFMGSGSTGCGAVKNGFEFIGIDLTLEYLEIAEKRIKRYLQIK